jgi:hypothetical protein
MSQTIRLSARTARDLLTIINVAIDGPACVDGRIVREEIRAHEVRHPHELVMR